ncbi:MAG: ABC transporter permease [Peptococcaceae bacterium]|nr:ABC transporter permease [Peptococcaceae bacterium]
MKNRAIWMPVLVAICAIALWEGAVRLFDVPLYILPAPSKILEAMIENRSELFMHTLVTLEEAVVGLVIALVLAMLTAILMDLSKTFRNSVYPHLVVTQTVPVMVLAPLFSIWLGFGMAPKVLIVIFMCYFPIAISFADGLAQVNPKQVNLLKSFRASTRQIYTMVKIPAAAPSLFSGLKVAATYCVGGAIVGEWISASAGLGYYMLRVKNGYMLDKVFATVVVVVIVSLLLNGLVTLAKHWLCPHHTTTK